MMRIDFSPPDITDLEIEDAAHAFGGRYKDKMLGEVADFTNFSFHAIKNFTTAEDGAVVWRNFPGIDHQEIYRKFMLLSLHGQSKDAFQNTDIQPMNHYVEGRFSTKHLYIVNLKGKTLEERNRVIEEMGQAGIACDVHFKPLPLYTAYRNLGFRMEEYPEAAKRYENVMTLPLHTKLTDEEIDYIARTLKEIIR